MRRNGPATHGVTEDALTVWDLTWTYRDHPVDNGCVLRDVRVMLTVTVTLPHWIPPPEAPQPLIAAWTTFLERIRVHEAGHQTIAERSARELASALSGLHAATCRTLWTTAERLATGVVERGRARNRAYDVETQHGQTQGVVLGP
jgi:predicted secreted Zn-dependent protease